ncbi:MAG TPA: hypothetical protein PLX23_12605 [Candidatus Hydrogenedens sp.]|nr:hypothetical protein [Candidatus Hydrogenedens sp.]
MTHFLRNNRFTKHIFVCLNNNVLSLMISLFLVLSFCSCFSPEQKIAPSSAKTGGENVIEHKKESIVNKPVQRLEEQDEEAQNTAPIRIQSTITPTIEWKKPKENIAENTEEVQTSVERDDIKPETETISEEESEVSELEDIFNQIKLGMRYEEVVKVLGEPDILVSQDSEGRMKLYRWTREGKSLYGRFEDGILKRHSQRSETESDNIVPLTRDLYEQLKIGMELDEVVALLQRPGTLVSSDDKGETLFLWTDKEGSSFSARFANNKLVRKSGFYVRPVSMPKAAEEVEETQVYEEPEESPINKFEDESTKETNEINVPILEQERKQVKEQPINQETENLVPQTTNQNQTKIVSNNRRIIYSGSRNKNVENQETETKQVSGRRKAKLPDYTYRLSDGSYEMKIYNPLDTPIKVGIRSGKRGKDISIPAGNTKTLKVPRGNYQIVYIREDDPSLLQEGGTIQIDGLFVGDVEVHLLK